MEKKKPFWKNFKFWGILFVAIMVIGGIGSALEDDELEEDPEESAEMEQEEPGESAEPEEDEEPEEEVEEVDPMDELEGEELVEYIVHEEIGETTNEEQERITEITAWSEDGAEMISLTLAGDSNLTSGMTERSLVTDSTNLFKSLYNDAGYEDIVITWQLMLVDTYGNESMGKVMMQSLSKDDLEQINWDNISTDQFSNISVDWKHPNIFD